MRVLFFVEGFTDIRFIAGLSGICRLTLAVPSGPFHESGLADRIVSRGLSLTVDEIPGGRIVFQARSLAYLLRRAKDFDVILAQEALRGALNATLVGKLRGVPVLTYVGISPVEYFRCRRARGEIGAAKALLGELAIRALMTVNGELATGCLAMGPYLVGIASRYCPRSGLGLYYGVDTERFRPASPDERRALRASLNFPQGKFLVVLSSRMSHEKDPETVLRAAAAARAAGLDLCLVNLGGGFEKFLSLARSLGISGDWVMGRPARHPVDELPGYFRAADALAMASLAEGAAFSTLEALACGTPVVVTAVGGMAVQLKDHARLVPRQDFAAMARELAWVAENPEAARAQALQGREYVVKEWDSRKAFHDLRDILQSLVR